MFSFRGILPPVLSTFIFCSLVLIPHQVKACACGCGVFDVSTQSVLPNGPGGTIWTEYDYANQDHNRSGGSSASDTANDDKKIRSNYYTVGGQYMFNRDWGVRATVPYVNRNVVSADDVTGEESSFEDFGIGDIRISAIYSGFSPDMSSGVTFGVKLPTGDDNEAGFSRDTAIGTGSTNLLLGAYHMGRLPNARFGWFANASLDLPVVTQDDYRPGTEINAALGGYYENWSVGDVKITPMAQAIATQRFHDNGANAEEGDTGYSRLMLSPGVEFAYHNTRLYTDVEVPVAQYVHSNQLAPSAQFKVILAQDF